MLAVALALAGAVLLWLPAFRYRIDAATCASWPSLAAGAGYAAAYVAAVALLSLAWLRAMSAGWSLRRALAAGALVHAVAIVAPPFASNDPLFYAAIGHSMSTAHASAATPLSSVLSPGDHFLTVLPARWRGGTSPYGAGFDQLARAVATVGGEDLGLQLRAYQVINVIALLATAALAGLAFGPPAATLVLFAPVAVVDGSVNPHNDVFIALLVAAFALARSRRREPLGLAALILALAIKLSAALLLAFELLRLALAPVAQRLRASTVVLVGSAVAVSAVAALVVAPRIWPTLAAFTALVGDPAETSPHFSRSWEGLPRALFTFVLHVPSVSWAIGLVFRAASGVWILYAAYRAARDRAPLAWAAIALFVYYLCLHAFLQAWYLIPLLALATQLPPYMTRPFKIFVVCLSLYYALAIPLDCDERPLVIGVKELAEAILVVLPAFFTLLFAWRRRARASDGTPRPVS
ncbi:MAG: hypothetical protein JWN44_4178 [Myxococcales bacterium]|nr:hypothetical protein [Myxococcales bacterium]